MDRLTRFVDFIRTCPRAGAPLIDGFRDHCESGSDVRRCGECLADLCGPPSADAGESRSSGESFALAAMVPGQRARIERVPVRPGAPARLADMGVAPGAVLEVERTGPGGDPLYVLVNGYHLSIRRGEAKDILLRAL